MVKKNNKETKSVSGSPNLMDKLFLLTLLGVVAFVAWVGCLAYQEGVKIETSKRHGEAWLQWLGDASGKRFQPGFEPSACTGLPAPAAEASTPTVAGAAGGSWGSCYKALTGPGGAWADSMNAFSGQQVRLVPKCDKSDLSVAGEFFFEKLMPTPPGSPMPVVPSSLMETDTLDAKVLLRLTLCDKGGDPIRIGEVEF